MGFQSQVPEIPVIDFSREEVKPGSPCWVSMSSQVRHALEEHGCFVVKYEPLTPQLCDQLLSQTKDMFDLPSEIKMRNTSDQPLRGPAWFNLPHFIESMGIDNARSLQQTQNFADAIWPAGKDQFCEVVTSYAKLLGALNDLVNKMVFESYGVGKYYASIDASNSQVLRFLKMKPQDTEVNNIERLPAHKDVSFSTIVHQIDIPGLEVEAKDGTWIQIEPQPSHFMFFAGLGMQAWSNDRIKGCKHQVSISRERERYSMGLFTFNNGVIQVPEEMVDDDHPLLYNSFDHPGFLQFYHDTINTSEDAASNLQFDNPLKAFCGVEA